MIDFGIKTKSKLKLVTLQRFVLIVVLSIFLGRVTQGQTPPVVIQVTLPDVSELSWNPDGTLLAVSAGNEIVIYDNSLGEVTRLQGHLAEILTVDWSSDGNRIASGDDAGSVIIWDGASGTTFGNQMASYQTNNLHVTKVKWSPVQADYRLAIVSIRQLLERGGEGFVEYKVQIWDSVLAQAIDVIASDFYDAWALNWASDATVILVGGESLGNDYSVSTWNTSNGAFEHLVSYFAEIQIYDFSMNSTGELVAITSGTGRISISDLQNQTVPYNLTGEGSQFTRVDWNQSNLLAASSNQGNITIWDMYTAQVISSFQGHDSNVEVLKWNFDGSKLASIDTQNGILKIWDMASLPNLDGTPTITPLPTITPSVTNLPISTATATPLPVDKFAFAMMEGGVDDYPHLFTIDLNGTDVTRLTDSTEFSRVESPSWSPDGTRIVFAAALPQESTLQIFVANADGSNALQLTDGITPSVDPSWSPDGRWIVFTSEQQGNKDIFATKSDGSTITSPIRITTNPADDFNPEWTVSGRIVFVSNRDRPSSSDIYTVGIDGANTIRITNTSAFDDHPTWSPDGQRIAFSAQSANLSDIYVINSDGSNAQLVAQNVNSASFGWSPDGSQIVYSADYTEVNIVDTNTLVSIVLYSNTEDVGGVSWARGQGSMILPTPTPSNTLTFTPSVTPTVTPTPTAIPCGINVAAELRA